MAWWPGALLRLAFCFLLFQHNPMATRPLLVVCTLATRRLVQGAAGDEPAERAPYWRGGNNQPPPANARGLRTERGCQDPNQRPRLIHVSLIGRTKDGLTHDGLCTPGARLVRASSSLSPTFQAASRRLYRTSLLARGRGVVLRGAVAAAPRLRGARRPG